VLNWKKDIEARETIRLPSEPSNTPLITFLENYCQHLVANQSSVGAYNDLSRLRCFFGLCTEALHYRPRGRSTPDAPKGMLVMSVKKSGRPHPADDLDTAEPRRLFD
jgi:hypothetical protein